MSLIEEEVNVGMDRLTGCVYKTMIEFKGE